jgi:hypothetical protein
MVNLPLADRHETILPDAPGPLREAYTAALTLDRSARKVAIGELVAEHPTFIEGWAALAVLGGEPIERYAYARVGYHRGLDALRSNGWGGSGLVRWSVATNRPFLTCLVRLRESARAIGETAEVERIDAFLRDLDPDWSDGNLPV